MDVVLYAVPLRISSLNEGSYSAGLVSSLDAPWWPGLEFDDDGFLALAQCHGTVG